MKLEITVEVPDVEVPDDECGHIDLFVPALMHAVTDICTLASCTGFDGREQRYRREGKDLNGLWQWRTENAIAHPEAESSVSPPKRKRCTIGREGTSMTRQQLSALTVDDLFSAYTAPKEGCRCGCIGTYSYVAANREAASDNRGYEIADDEVNDAEVERILHIVQREMPFTPQGDDLTDVYANVSMSSGRVYTVYFKLSSDEPAVSRARTNALPGTPSKKLIG